MSSPRKNMHGFIREIIGVRQQERQCTRTDDAGEQAMKTRVMQRHLAVGVAEYSPWQCSGLRVRQAACHQSTSIDI
jgi:hypothetical protein